MLKLYDTKEAVPEVLRENALETKDGKFAVDEPNPNEISPAAQSAIEKMKEKEKAAEKARIAAEKERDELKRAQEARDQGISEESLKKIRADEEKARQPIIEERDRLAEENRKLKLNDRLLALWLKHGGHPERQEDAMDALLKRADLGDSGGIVYKGKDGAITADDDATFFKKFKAEKPWFFKGSGSSGGGASGSDGSDVDVEVDPKSKEAVLANKRREMAGLL